MQKRAQQDKFPEGWSPRKRLSPDALDGIRALHRQFPAAYTTADLAGRFGVSPEAIRRILRGRWRPSPAEEEDRQLRWFNRGRAVWSRWAELGRKPPTRWRREGIRRNHQLDRRQGSSSSGPGTARIGGGGGGLGEEEDGARTDSRGKRVRLAALKRLSEDVM